MAAASPESDIRILLVGRTGHGKSATGNSIIGEDKFKVSASAKSVTTTSEWSGICWRFGRTVEVVDTPGIFDTHRESEEIHKELIKSLLYTTPGFHAIVFVLERGRFTEELVKTKDLFFSWFGSGVEKFACIIMTRTEDENEVDEYLSSDTVSGLEDLVRRCGGRRRVAAIDNKADPEKKSKQVKRILKMIEEIKKSNGNTHFSNVAFELATTYAYSKRSKHSQQISSNSILILQQAGLRMQLSSTECKMIDSIFDIQDSIETSSDSVEVHPRPTKINRLNRKVDINSVRFQPMSSDTARQVTGEEQTRGTDDSPDSISKLKVENKLCSFDNAHETPLDNSQCVDDGNADVDPLYQYKDDVRKGKTSEKGLLNHIKSLWILGKKKFRCTLQ